MLKQGVKLVSLIVSSLLLCVSQLLCISSATVNAQTDSAANRPTSYDTPGKSEARPVSKETAEEAKRLFKDGVKYARAGLFKQAAELFERVVRMKPDYADAHYSLGHVYCDLRQWRDAVPPLQTALQLNPKDKQARALLDQAQRNLNEGADETSGPVGTPVSAPKPIDTNTTNPAASITRSRTVTDEQALTRLYRVGVGDVLEVSWGGATAGKASAITVTPAGLLEHANLTEPLTVAGLTTTEIEDLVEKQLKQRGLNAATRSSVGVAEYVSHTLLVSGLVKEPGTKVIKREAIPLYVVIADAQPLPEATRASLIKKKTGDVLVIDLSKPVDVNLLASPGDVVNVQADPPLFVYITGEVKSPGERSFREGMTLTQAIMAAGGLTANAKEARIARDDGKGFLADTRFKLKNIESGKSPDPPVQPGDRITIVD
jgi:protein involved in polysaccharide export with SLBB domain